MTAPHDARHDARHDPPPSTSSAVGETAGLNGPDYMHVGLVDPRRRRAVVTPPVTDDDADDGSALLDRVRAPAPGDEGWDGLD